jgi:excisionase family DNA binding protein
MLVRRVLQSACQVYKRQVRRGRAMEGDSARNPVWTVPEAASYLKVSTATIWRWCATGRLVAFKIGREWRIADPMLDRLAARGLAPAAGQRVSL